MSIAWLLSRFEEARGLEAVVLEEAHTYGELLQALELARASLDSAGVSDGTVVSIEADYSLPAIAMLLASIERRCLVVPLTSSVRDRIPRFLDIAQVQVRLQERRGAFSVSRREQVLDHPLLETLRQREHPGLVLFSSGSTGEPKAVLHDFVPLLEKFQTKRHCLRTITFLLLDHIGGINTLFYVLSNAGTVIAIRERDPDSVCRAVEEHQVELLPTSPTFLNLLLLSEATRRYDLSSLKLITYGTEPMPQSTLDRLSTALPHARLLQTYGLSEVGILRSKSRSSESLWVRVGGEGFETRVVDGLLHVRAKSSMLGYLNAPSPFDDEGWFNTGDAVIQDGDYLRILGRKSEIINVGGEKVYPAEVESVLLEMPNVVDATVTGAPNPITGQMVVATVALSEPETRSALRRRVRAHCQGRLEKFKIPSKVKIAHGELHSGRFKRIRRPDPDV